MWMTCRLVCLFIQGQPCQSIHIKKRGEPRLITPWRGNITLHKNITTDRVLYYSLLQALTHKPWDMLSLSAAPTTAAPAAKLSRVPSAALHQKTTSAAFFSQKVTQNPNERPSLNFCLPLRCVFFLFLTKRKILQVQLNSLRSSCSAIKSMADSQTISVPKNEQQSPASGDSYYQIQFYLFIFFLYFLFCSWFGIVFIYQSADLILFSNQLKNVVYYVYVLQARSKHWYLYQTKRTWLFSVLGYNN